MPGKIIKEYFSFTKKERIGVIILVFIILIVFILPYLLPGRKEMLNKAEWEQFKRESANLQKADTPQLSLQRNDERRFSSSGSLANATTNKEAYLKSELFYFDPNTLSVKGWEKLGLRAKTISTIQNYIAKGGKFRHSEELGKVYGLHANELARLMPYVKISNPAFTIKKSFTVQGFKHDNPYHSAPAKYYSVPVVDINTADTTQLIDLPGIGSKLATRIITFREKLGAFYSVDQLADVYGLPDSTFQKLRPRLTVSTKVLKIKNINTADANELKQLPYLKWNIANAIVEFRSRHGDFKDLEELLQIEIFTEPMLKKMSPYLTVQ